MSQPPAFKTSRHVAAATDVERLARGNAEVDAWLTDQQPAILSVEQGVDWLEIPSGTMTHIPVAVVVTTAPFAEPAPIPAPRRRVGRAPYPDKRWFEIGQQLVNWGAEMQASLAAGASVNAQYTSISHAASSTEQQPYSTAARLPPAQESQTRAPRTWRELAHSTNACAPPARIVAWQRMHSSLLSETLPRPRYCSSWSWNAGSCNGTPASWDARFSAAGHARTWPALSRSATWTLTECIETESTSQTQVPALGSPTSSGAMPTKDTCSQRPAHGPLTGSLRSGRPPSQWSAQRGQATAHLNNPAE